MTDARSTSPDVSGGDTAERRVLTAQRIAELVGGRLLGSPDVAVDHVSPIERAGPGSLTFLASARYAKALERGEASVVLVSEQLLEAPGAVAARIVVSDPQQAMLKVLPVLYRPAVVTPAVDATARIGRGARVGRGIVLGPYAVVGEGAVVGDRVQIDAHAVVGAGVTVGADSHLFPHVTVYAGTSIGERVAIHAGARVGCDGFGYVLGDGAHQKIPHIGRCVIEDDVEIGANATIDRGSIDDTVVGAGTKIDNLVHVAHNVRIGRLCLIMAQVGIAGSVRLGDGCVLAGQVGVSGHHTVGDGARLAAQAGVFGDIPSGETWSGYPARPHNQSLRATAALFKLSGMIKQLEKLLSKPL